ncbi:LAETG motif-containing sortase-dependent surface protein [Streptomyces sp. ME01-24h]|nr:LAETG motif-containing sortase-dependent surface protein [Streptomyces sp. ME19-03-3]MDX3352736.1 LAETG motif-containing sortase-dependent surface protein [Streptomyces sp. ME01-24h]
MTASPRRAWHRPGTLIAAAATGVIGLGLCATPASAHTRTWTVDCSHVEFNLQAYSGNVKNTVTLTADGKELLPTTTFGRSFTQTLDLPPHTAEVKLHLSVVAGDDKRGNKGYSFEDDATAPVCEGSGQPTPPVTPTPTPTETKTTESPKPSETPSVSPSESADTAPSAAPSTPSTDESPAGDLAETGASSSTPLLAGGAAVALLAGGGLLFANRKRRAAARH